MKGSPAKPPRHPSPTRANQQPSAPPLYEEGDESLLPPPPLAVPLGYGSGSPPPLYESVVPAMPLYRQQYQQAPAYRMASPQRPVRAQQSDAYASPPAVYLSYNASSATPPEALAMHRPRGSHRTFHQMYTQQSQSPSQRQQQRDPSRCAGICYFLKLLLFNAANGVLGIAGFAVVSAGLMLTLVTLPLCCFGVVLFRVLLRVVYVGCKLDAVLHNLIAGDDEKIQFGLHHIYNHHLHSQSSSYAERHSLLPTQIDWQLQPHHHQQDDDQLPQFEKSLADVSPRAVLATIYFGSIKFLVGIFSVIAIALVGFVLAFFVDGDDLQHQLDDNDVQVGDGDPFTMYMFAIGLAFFAVAMLFANARISQAITRFFCCEGGV